ncbi:MAG: glycosyltransferase [Acidobacteriota bacterium]|nr:glycosyltransferase [Acidobacteriota bacterium]
METAVVKERPTSSGRIESKLRVLHVGKYYPPHPGGMESHLEALCGELKRSIDLEIVVATSNGLGTSVELLNGVRVTRAGRLFNLRSAPFCPQMVRKIRASKAALVHIHLPNPGAVLAYLASGHRGRLVITYHSDIVRQKVLSRVLDPILQHALNRADAIIVSSSNYIKSSYVLPFYQNKCRVIPFGIPLDHFQRPDAAEVARLRHLYGPRIVLGVGRLVYYKGFEHLIEAMNFIQGRLVIVGHGPLHNALQQKAESCGVSERVTFLTDVQDVRPYYHAADVFALSSVARSEAFGIVQLEAMACGKPVVNTRLDSGVPSVSLDGVSGITVPPANPEEMGKAINSLLSDPLRSAAYGRAGQLRVKQHFSLQGMVRQTLTLYHEVMNSSRHK